MATPGIYMDYQATTPLDPRVLEAMLPWMTERFGNPASVLHAHGREAAEAVARAREAVAALAGADPEGVIFTSGATEADNLAVRGTAGARAEPGHLITVATEHHAVLDPMKALERQGWALTVLPVDADGLVAPADVAAALRPDTALVSVMAANNEIGVLQPVREIAALARERGVPFHCDAAQAAGQEPLALEVDGIALMSLSAHKLYGPKGVGALCLRRGRPRVRLSPLMDGGGQERGLRPGTLNVPGIVGFGEACRLAMAGMDAERARLAALRDRLLAGLRAAVPGVRLNGHPTRRLAGSLNVSFEGVDGDLLLDALPGLSVSSGSACTTARLEPSHVLKALGVDDALARASIRFSLGRPSTAAEVDAAVRIVADRVRRLRTQAVPQEVHA